jgi:hypothetical protein
VVLSASGEKSKRQEWMKDCHAPNRCLLHPSRASQRLVPETSVTVFSVRVTERAADPAVEQEMDLLHPWG